MIQNDAEAEDILQETYIKAPCMDQKNCPSGNRYS